MFNDTEDTVEVVIDEYLRVATQLNFHPMTHTESIGLTWLQLTAFMTSTGHSPVFARLDDDQPAPGDGE